MTTSPYLDRRVLAWPLRPPWIWRAAAGIAAFLLVLAGAVALAAAVAVGLGSGFGAIFTLGCGLLVGMFVIVRIKPAIERALGRRWHRVTLDADGTLSFRTGRVAPGLRVRLDRITRLEPGAWDAVTSTTVNNRPMKVVVRTAHLTIATADCTVVLVADDWGGERETIGWPRREPPDRPAPVRMYARDLVELVGAIAPRTPRAVAGG